MARKVNRPPYRQEDPSPGGGLRRRGRRVLVFVVIVVFAGIELAAGHDLKTVLPTLLGVGLAGAMVARWVCDDAPLPGIGWMLGPDPQHPGGGR